jgi:hypothetical protein
MDSAVDSFLIWKILTLLKNNLLIIQLFNYYVIIVFIPLQKTSKAPEDKRDDSKKLETNQLLIKI